MLEGGCKAFQTGTVLDKNRVNIHQFSRHMESINMKELL